MSYDLTSSETDDADWLLRSSNLTSSETGGADWPGQLTLRHQKPGGANWHGQAVHFTTSHTKRRGLVGSGQLT